MSSQITILVDEKTPLGAEDDRHLLLDDLDLNVSFMSWRTLDARMIHESRAVVMRSPYSYIDDPVLFIEHLKRIEDAGCVLLNPLEVVRWNMHKQYLIQMRDQFDVNVPSMVLLNKPISSEEDVQGMLSEHLDSDGKCLIIKPAISAGSKDTFKVSKTNYRDHLEGIIRAGFGADREYIVQEYVSTIETEGELSLIFLGGKFSHAIRKIPAHKDFRVQAMYGGRNILEESVDRQALRFGEVIIDALREIFPKDVSSKILYSRIDLVQMPTLGESSRYGLMEIEMIEPRLFFNEAGLPALYLFAHQLNSILSEHTGRNIAEREIDSLSLMPDYPKTLSVSHG